MVLAPIDLTDTQAYWPVDELRPNQANPRGEVSPDSVTELADSIRAQGVLQPILCTPSGIVVAGHRRLAAARLAGLREVPVIVRELSESEQLAAMLVENLEREDLTPLQEARAYARLKGMHLTNMDIARRVGVPAHRVQKLLAILNLTPEVQAMFESYELPESLAVVLLKVPDPDRQRRLASIASRRGLTTKTLMELIARGEGDLTAKPGPKPKLETLPDNERMKGAGRLQAMDRLRRDPGRKLSYSDLLKQFDLICGVCGDCGMSGIREVCSACPLPELVMRLTK